MLTREVSIAKAKGAVAGLDGFVKVVLDGIGAFPKVGLCKFSSHSSMMAAARTKKSIASMEGFWMAPDRSLEDRMEYQRLFKEKRGIIEATNRPGYEIVVDKLPRQIFAFSGLRLVEICHSPMAGEMNWSDAIRLHVRSHVAEVFGE